MAVSSTCFDIAFCLVHILQEFHSFCNMLFGSMATLGPCRENRLNHPMLITAL